MNTNWSLVAGAVSDGNVVHVLPGQPTARTVHPWGGPVPTGQRQVTFWAPCRAGHLAEWTETQVEGNRGDATVTDYWCPVCEGRNPGGAGPGGGPGGLGAGPGTSGRPGADLGAQSVTEGDAA